MSPPPQQPVPGTADPAGDEEVTPYDGDTEDDADGFPQPLAAEAEDEDPESLGGEEEDLPDEEGSA
jgi:hypothetical protein